ADLDAAAWRGVARQLVAHGLLRVDAQAYGALRVTEAAEPVLRGRARLDLRSVTPKPAARKARRRGRRSDGPAPAPLGLVGPQAELFEGLRVERKAIAEEQGVPAYVVFHDATLREIAARRPTTTDQLLDVPGIGAAKAERYGERILTVVAAGREAGGA
ncbi:MAG TPA: HRDC domain-containing protein, partial [Candidatus Nanopelagicales bacterium]